jgi:hypothetical protein
MTTATIHILDTFPAYTIIGGNKTFRFGDAFAIGYDTPRHGRLYDFFKLGSVATYAAQYGEDEEAAVEKAKERGHELYWANKQSTTISAHKQAHRTVWGLQIGDEIEVDGLRFRIERASNQNVKLVQI